MDFDPRDFDDARDPRDARDRDGRDPGHDDDALSLGRGPSSSQIEAHRDSRDRDDGRHDARDRADHRDRDDARWPERDRDPRDRAIDPREVFMRSLNLPRGRDREIVHDARDREYMLAAAVKLTVVAGENLTVGSTGTLPAASMAPGR
jgi:hypothetical protein